MGRVASRTIWCFAFVCLMAGCGGAKVPQPDTAAVKGTVTLDGAPMATGEVVFEVPGKSAVVLPVNSGAYSGQVAIGLNKVSVFSYRKGPVVDMGGEKFGGGMENFIPPQYNAESTMKANVEAGGANEFKFEVKSS